MNLQSKSHFFSNFFVFFSYFVVNTLFLSQFPFIHSDESWLSGLTRAFIGFKSVTVTEPFFDLLPRFPHAIKIVFHILQMPFLVLLGYTPFAARLLSLAAGTAALWIFHRLLRRWAPSAAVPVTILLAIDIQFIYASHFARQEILLVLCLVLALLFYSRELVQGELAERAPGSVKEFTPDVDVERAPGSETESAPGKGPGRKPAARGQCWNRLSAAVIGLSIGIHPNSFLIALPILAFLLIDTVPAFLTQDAGPQRFNNGRSAIRRLIEYAGILFLFAALFVGLSFLMDPQFLTHYRSFGDSVGVGEPLYMKFFRFPDFYIKLYRRISGTYYTPLIRLQFFLFAAALLTAPLVMVLHRPARLPLLKVLTAIFFINIGTLVLGKYSQPSIVLHFPLYYLLIGIILQSMSERYPKGKRRPAALQEHDRHPAGFRHDRTASLPGRHIPGTAALIAAVMLTGASLINTGYNLAMEFHLIGPKRAVPYETYRSYTRNIAGYLPPDTPVLANLNSEYYFDLGRLHDYRNLVYLDDAGLSFEQYIYSNGIRYIVYPQEMDIIHQRRPVWNILYGNVHEYYDEMQDFLEKKCVPEGEFESPVYGMRIVRYSGTRPWKVRIYRVLY